MRARKKKWAAGELSENSMVVLPEDARAAIIKGDGRPLHVEIGCGKGRFICEMAMRHPDVRFIAIECEPTIAAHAAKRTRMCGADCTFILANASALAQLFLADEISRLYLNFPDPWHRKKKWAKRRLTHDNFLAMYESLKIPEIFFKTDNRVLFEFSLEAFSRRRWVLSDVSLDLHANMPEENIVTEYEEKFCGAGPIYRLVARLPSSDYSRSP